MVSNNLIANCPISPSDIPNAWAIFRPDLASVRGKTVWRTLAPVVAEYVVVPHSLVDANQVVTLAADVFFMDSRAFLLRVSRRIKFVTAEHAPTRMAPSLSRHLKHVIKVYGHTGFGVRTILLMDGESIKIKLLMPTVECNTIEAKEHVSKAERTIRTLKEQMRSITMILPFEHIPKQMKINFVFLWCYGLMRSRWRWGSHWHTPCVSFLCNGN